MQDFIDSLSEAPTIAELRDLNREGVDIKSELSGDEYADAIIRELFDF